MKKLFKRIQKCAELDSAKSESDFFLYTIEEIGEIATCIAVNQSFKNKKLTEPLENEICDAILSLIGLLSKNKSIKYNTMLELMDKKLSRWESSVSGNKNV